MKSKLNILCGAGGTGGHLFPAIAVVEQLEKLHGNIEVHFAGRIDKIEGEKIPKLGYEFHPMRIRGVQKLLSFNNLMIPFELVASVNKMRKVIRKNQIDLVLCTGSYISFPPGRAAVKEKTPLFLMESNVNPGKSINMLAKDASMIFTSFENSFTYFEQEIEKKIKFVGNPVRKSIIELPNKNLAREKLGYGINDRIVFVFGGSLGAKSINLAIDNDLEKYAEQDIQLIWQTGKLFETKKKLPNNVWQTMFIDDMATVYAASDLIVSRSGATTVAELTATGKPAVLIPLESASNDEQKLNAEVMHKELASKMLLNNDLNNLLFDTIMNLIGNPIKLNEMSENAKRLAKPNAAMETANEILKYMENQIG